MDKETQHGYLSKNTAIIIPAACVVQNCERAADKMYPDKDLESKVQSPTFDRLSPACICITGSAPITERDDAWGRGTRKQIPVVANGVSIITKGSEEKDMCQRHDEKLEQGRGRAL